MARGNGQQEPHASNPPGREPSPERFAFVLVPNFSMMAFVSALEALRIANRMAGRTLYG